MAKQRTFTPQPALPGRARRGSVYVAVLALSVLLITLALGSFLAVRVQVRTVELRHDIAEARLYARSGLEVGRLWVDQDPSWRATWSNGTWVVNRAIGNGTFTLEGRNPNGPLNASDLDPVILTATGMRGRARQKVQATLNAMQTPYTCLSTALTAATSITLQTATISATGLTIASNGSISAQNCNVNANVEAVGTISGGTYHGSIRAAARARTMPRANVFDYYVANGTLINWSSIPSATLNAVLLSPSSNPYGTQTNLNGIYVIDCQNRTITINNCRIVGTLVLLNPGSGSAVQGSINWSPAAPSLPTLLVRGDVTLKMSGSALSESGTGTNFNPVGTPYPFPAGTTDSTITDTYPSHLGGMTYVSGNVTFTTSANLGMLICGGTVTLSSSVSSVALSYDGVYAATPPPGFSAVSMVLEEGSYRQVVDP